MDQMTALVPSMLQAVQLNDTEKINETLGSLATMTGAKPHQHQAPQVPQNHAVGEASKAEDDVQMLEEHRKRRRGRTRKSLPTMPGEL